ncbi:hypothetical protein K449DRAFT_62822 [Hypoxylon sp. EC38]|nr:hypothetical protein K449DRAFT_62822 [Hypoxylon sp. EC38]
MSRVSRSTRQSQQRTAHNPMERQLERSPSPIPQRVRNSVRIDSQTRRFRSIHEEATASESSTMAERRPLLDSHNPEEFTATGSSMASEHRVPNPEKLQDRPSTTRRVYSSAFAHRRRPISNQYSTPERTLTSLLRNWVQHRRSRGNNASSHASSEGQRLLSTSPDGKNEQPDHPDSPVSAIALQEASREDTERFEPGSPSSVITVIRVSAPAESNSSHESNGSERVNIPVAVSRSLSLSLDRNVLAWRSRSDPGPLSPIQASAVGTAPTSSGIRPREAVSNGVNGNTGPSATSSDIGSQSLDNISLPVSRSLGNSRSSSAVEALTAIADTYTVRSQDNDGTNGTSSTSASSSLVLHNPYTPPGTPEHNVATVGIDGTSSLPEAPSSIAASKRVETTNNRPVSSHSTESSTPGASHRMRMTNREDMSLLAAASSPPRYTFFAPFDDQRAEPPSPRQDANRSPPQHSASQRRSSRPPTGRRERVQDHVISRVSPSRSNRSLRPRSPDQARRLASFRTHPYVLGGRDLGPSTASTSVETRGRNQQQREEGQDRQEVGLGIFLLDTAEQQQDQRENNLQNLIDEQYQGGVAEQEQDDDQRTIVDLEQQTVLARPLSIKERLKKTWRCMSCFPMSTSKKMVCLVFLGLSIVIIIGGPPFWFFFR